MKEQLLNTLKKNEKKPEITGIKDWLLTISETQVVSMGLHSMEIGSVYSPFQSRQFLIGNLYIRWMDGMTSRMPLTRPLIRDSESLLKLMRDSAFEDAFAPDIPEPLPKSDVEVYSPAVEVLIGENSQQLIEFLNQAQSCFQSLQTKNCMAEIECHIQNRQIANSRGLDSQFRTTKMSFGAAADSQYGIDVASRDVLHPDQTKQLLNHLKDMIQVIRNSVTGKGEISTIILMPSVAQAFIEKFLIENLDAEKIFDKRSAFQIEEFSSQKQRFHESFSLTHDPCRPLHAGSYPMDQQGIPAQPVTFIQNGRLSNAQVTLKGSRQTGWKPTPLANSDSLMVCCPNHLDLFDFISKTEKAFLVKSVLGLHTQDSGRGDYSVAVPHGIVIENGKMIGSAKAILSGNFFDVLQQKMIGLSSPYHSFNALCFQGKVIF